MKQEDIKKALECCKENYSCDKCNFEPTKHQIGSVGCMHELLIDVLDLINQYEAEIKSLKESLNIEFENFATEYDNKMKAEAIKEFAERLKEKFPNNSHWVRPREMVDNLLKEMRVTINE